MQEHCDQNEEHESVLFPHVLLFCYEMDSTLRNQEIDGATWMLAVNYD